VGLIDSGPVWFTRDRATYVQGRGAARRHKNPLAVFPCNPDPPCPPYDVGVVVTSQGEGPSFWRTRLPSGPRTVIFVPDTGRGDPAGDPATYTRLARTVQVVSLDLPEEKQPYPYRLVTAVVLAEVARRLGWNP
jgi:hypothetical protein